MGISMIGYKMIYKNVIYNLISVIFHGEWDSDKKINIIKDIEAMYIDENNRMVQIIDKIEEFQFISK